MVFDNNNNTDSDLGNPNKDRITFTTIVIGNDGKTYDLGKFEFIPPDVLPINACGVQIQEKKVEKIKKKKK